MRRIQQVIVLMRNYRGGHDQDGAAERFDPARPTIAQCHIVEPTPVSRQVGDRQALACKLVGDFGSSSRELEWLFLRSDVYEIFQRRERQVLRRINNPDSGVMPPCRSQQPACPVKGRMQLPTQSPYELQLYKP